ncbi:MAG TPA: glycosyltransferase family 2 protein [Thermoleophilaceae bacterium]|nr:glycosyltransferase family 2 protein [Thermoleophilaceae bacterium]
MSEPLVSIGVPTFNRAERLTRAVESVLRQTHERIEVTILDNASGDGTEQIAREIAERDARVRYVRHPRNIGPEANFNAAFEAAGGEFAMLVADDDLIAPDYIERCLAALAGDAGLSVAAGRARYLRDGAEVPFGRPLELMQPDPAERVRAYFGSVEDNAPFYGLIRREALAAQPPLRRVLGFDWLRVAGLAFSGRIARVAETSITFELGGASESTAKNVGVSRLPRAQAKVPHLVIARQVLAEIGWRSPVFAPLGRPGRLRLAASCAAAIPRRNARHVAFHLAPAPVQRAWQRRSER